MSGNVHHAQLRSSRVLARDVVEYRFALAPDDAALPWRAGQFISLTCGHAADGEPVLRSYSIANRPGRGEVDLVLKLVAGGAASEWFRGLREGSPVRFTGPMGFFVLDLQPHPGDLVFCATGTGIAPIVPMIAEVIERGDPGRIHLLWGLRDEGDRFWQEPIEALEAAAGGRMSSTLSLSRPAAEWTGERGRITARAVALLPSLVRPTFYLCGNGAMIKDVKAELVERGVDRKRQIRTEAFF